jgi:hypothetical protein
MSGPIANTSVLLRASFDDWRPSPLTLQDSGEWTVTRVVPPSKQFFVFEVDGVIRVAEDEVFAPTSTGTSTSAQVRPGQSVPFPTPIPPQTRSRTLAQTQVPPFSPLVLRRLPVTPCTMSLRGPLVCAAYPNLFAVVPCVVSSRHATVTPRVPLRVWRCVDLQHV